QAVADEVDAAAPDPLAERLAQLQGRALDAVRARVAEGEEGPHAVRLEIRGERIERRAVPQIAVDEHDGSLLCAPPSALAARPDAEGIEQRRGGERHQFAPDQARRRAVGRRKIPDGSAGHAASLTGLSVD